MSVSDKLVRTPSLEIKHDQIVSGEYYGWRRFLEYFKILSRPGDLKKLRRKQNQIKRLNDQIAPLAAQIKKLHAEILATCPHPAETQKVVSDGREDSYGSYISGNDYVIACLMCGQRLARFSSEDESRNDFSPKGK